MTADIPFGPMSAAPPPLANMIRKLLKKDPSERVGWAELASDPLWDGALQYKAAVAVEAHMRRVLPLGPAATAAMPPSSAGSTATLMNVGAAAANEVQRHQHSSRPIAPSARAVTSPRPESAGFQGRGGSFGDDDDSGGGKEQEEGAAEALMQMPDVSGLSMQDLHADAAKEARQRRGSLDEMRMNDRSVLTHSTPMATFRPKLRPGNAVVEQPPPMGELAIVAETFGRRLDSSKDSTHHNQGHNRHQHQHTPPSSASSSLTRPTTTGLQSKLPRPASVKSGNPFLPNNLREDTDAVACCSLAVY